jgi:hypothetical protein
MSGSLVRRGLVAQLATAALSSDAWHTKTRNVRKAGVLGVRMKSSPQRINAMLAMLAGSSIGSAGEEVNPYCDVFTEITKSI